ncbi:MAG: C40 family peptidase [Bacteroidota bacterium]
MNFRSLCLCILLFTSLFQCAEFRSVVGEPATTDTRRGNSTTQLRQNMVDFALAQQGAGYQYGGRLPRTGFDCSGFTYFVYQNFDLQLTPVSRVQETEGRTIKLAQAQPGDLVFFRRSAAGKVFHVALVVENSSDGLYVIHSTSSRGVIRQRITGNSYWEPKLSTARRYF